MNYKMSTNKIDFAALLAKVKANAENPSPPPSTLAQGIREVLPKIETVNDTVTGMHGELITYNSKQQEFINLAAAGKSCVLIGAAGTGKTTCSQGALKAILNSTDLAIPPLMADGHKHLQDNTPGVVICSYTRRAVNNIRKVQTADLKNNCITVHKLLEYAPVYYDVLDPETNEIKHTMRFEPSRNAHRPLPTSIHTIVIEEASMLGGLPKEMGENRGELYNQLLAALSHEVQFIFIGDIQQLPPVFGPAILGFKLNELPTIELTQVYRQALESPIIKLAHQILSGVPIPVEEYADWHVPGKLTIHPWKKKLHPDHAIMTLAAFFKKGIDTKLYDPNEDMILIPYNKACGTLELNKHIANHLARKRNAMTYEVVAGFIKVYLSEGDKVLYDREDAEIMSIELNPSYTGAKYQPCSRNLDYWGHNPKAAEERNGHKADYAEDDVDFLLEQVASSDDRVNQASHKVVVRLLDSETEVTLSGSAEINTLLHAYALTVHKSQGSEWRKVFLGFHQSHAVMMQRELLYTAVTRAREELYIICEPETFTKGIISQRIKGDTLAEKAEFFKGKLPKEVMNPTPEEN
jgi:exodeoxyribonuclease V alpha subunit